MKRFISGLLAMVLLVCMSSVALAASESVTTADGIKITFDNVTFKESGTLKIREWNARVDAWEVDAVVYHVAKGSQARSNATDLGLFDPPNGVNDYWQLSGSTAVESSTFPIYDNLMYRIGGNIFFTTNQTPIFGGSSTSKPTQETKKQDNQATTSTTNKPTHSRSTDIPYEVKMGDTFGVLALNYFGNMNYWRAIYNYNMEAIQAAPNKQIYEGMELIIPGAIQHGDKVINVISPAVAGEGEKLYTVKEGDTYGTIALAHFGDMSRYKEIFNRNSDRLQDLNTLYAGQIIVLPKK